MQLHLGGNLKMIPSSPALRRLYRAPVGLFRAGLVGWVRHVAAEWILVTTRGRRSGRPHEVLVDLLARDADSGTFYVQSAYGRQSDWVRNLDVTPEVRIRFRGRDVNGRARLLSREEARPVIESYVRTHPVYARVIARFLGYRGALASTAELCDWLARSFLTFAMAALPKSSEGDAESP